MLAFDRRPLDTRVVRLQTVALEYYTETETHLLEEEDLEGGRNDLARLEGSSVVAAVHTRQTVRKV